MLAFNIHWDSIVEKVREIHIPQEPDEPEEEKPVREPVPSLPKKGGKRIDIALDGEEREKPKRGQAIEIAPPNVKTPAEILTGQTEPKKGVEAPPPEKDEFDPFDDDFISDYDLPKQTDGLMLASEESDNIAAAEKEKEKKLSLDALLPWKKEPKKDEPVIIKSEEETTEPEDDAPLADRYDAVKPKHEGPIEITPRNAETASIAPSITGTAPKLPEGVAKLTKNDVAEGTHEVMTEIEEMMNKHNELDIKEYLYPPVSLLKRSEPVSSDIAKETKMLADRLVDTLLSFGIDSNVVGVTRGPTVTRYELTLQRGTKFSRVSNLSEDIALSLGAQSIRISTIPDKLAIGIEVPNSQQQVVTIRDIIDSAEFRNHKSKICFPVGKDIANKSVIGDIGKMPHMLIAGTTGSGKSVCINSILISLLYKSSPEEVRLIMIDPKMIELGVYNGIPHLLIPVVTDPKKASGALNWAVSEMMRRYKLLSDMGVRDLASYNEEIKARGEGETLPQIVIVIDELADLMFVAAREVEEAIARIAQMARAAGMHLIIATQRPSADIITGIMKANIPSRVAFAVASQIESRIILDTPGAEKLIGKGDMLYAPLGMPKPMRVQGCFITTAEVEAVVEFIKKTSTSDYKSDIIEHIEHAAENTGKGGGGGGTTGGDPTDDDPLMDEAISIVVGTGQASTSMLQRKLKLGYSRASRLIDQMEERGIVGPFEGSKPRQVLITKQEWQEMMVRKNEEF
ncbi:MAG: DNA translocase FtsK [Clostridia bacterium]|nr:DNA translocase FtsK [Clostridia bacterium]